MLQPDWPPWAFYTFLGLAGFTAVVAVIQMIRDRGDTDATDSHPQGEKAPEFRKFQREYLTVYAIIMMADWFQGTNMYTLYSSYGVNISALFLSGFLSGACWAGPVGLWIDRYGRKKSCIVYLVLEIIINICEHYNNFAVLWISRFLGGVTTCILFTGFESWMVSEHRKRGFPEAWVADTFSKGSFINGLSAIIAGILAQVCADLCGEIGPFQAAIALTALALVFVAFWPENYGGGDSDDADTKAAAWNLLKTDRKAVFLGSVNALFEGSMYSFVFMWVPTMLGALQGAKLPTGLVFASMMTCISLGGVLFSPSMLLTLAPAEVLGCRLLCRRRLRPARPRLLHCGGACPFGLPRLRGVRGHLPALRWGLAVQGHPGQAAGERHEHVSDPPQQPRRCGHAAHRLLPGALRLRRHHGMDADRRLPTGGGDPRIGAGRRAR